MAGLEFNSKIPKEQENEEVVKYNTKVGVFLFFIYVLFYATFMILCSFANETMSTPVFGGVNLSIMYGFFLIVLALAMALLYMKLCRKSGKVG